MKKQAVVFMITGLIVVNAFAQKTYLDVVINYTLTGMSFGDYNKELKRNMLPLCRSLNRFANS